MNSKSYVSLETNKCPICLTEYESGSIFLDKRLRNSLDHKTCTSFAGLCPDCQKLHTDGFLTLIGCEESKTVFFKNGNVKFEDAYRTGTLIRIKREAANKIFDLDSTAIERPFMMASQETIDYLMSIAHPDDCKVINGEKQELEP